MIFFKKSIPSPEPLSQFKLNLVKHPCVKGTLFLTRKGPIVFQKGHNMWFFFINYNHSFAEMYLMIGTYFFVHGSLSNRYKRDIAKEMGFCIIFRLVR